jgi:phospholipid transport system substrate-binding protein
MKTSARRTIRALAIAALLASGALSQGAAAASPGAQDAVRDFYQVLLATMKQGSALGAGGRYDELSPAVLRTFDIPFMTRLAAGPSWAGLPDAEKRALTDAFGHYVTATWAQRFDSYSGERLEVTVERSEFSSVLNAEGADGLIMKLNQKVTTLAENVVP